MLPGWKKRSRSSARSAVARPVTSTGGSGDIAATLPLTILPFCLHQPVLHDRVVLAERGIWEGRRYWAWETLDMLKSGTSSGGVAVRGK